MHRALLITNPVAARFAPAAVKTVLATMRQAGWQTETCVTGGPGDARRLAAQGVNDGVETVVVFGGDGTTMQAAAALVGTDVQLGVIPGGTGNLLAGNLRIPTAPARAARTLVSARPQILDLGRMQRSDGVHYFAVACGAGYDARVMAGTMAEHKRRWGMAAYVATTFRLINEIRCCTHRITIDGVAYEVNAAVVLVANCGEVIPPYVRLRPGIRHDDGLLDVIALRADGLTQSFRAVWDLLRVAQGDLGSGRFVGYARGREIKVETDPVEPVELDGEPGGETPFTATIVPGAIRILAP